jgi:hypothetical protein
VLHVCLTPPSPVLFPLLRQLVLPETRAMVRVAEHTRAYGHFRAGGVRCNSTDIRDSVGSNRVMLGAWKAAPLAAIRPSRVWRTATTFEVS